MAASQTQGSATGQSPLVKLTIFFKKRADLSDEEFNTYWSGKHAAIFGSTSIAKEKVVKYNQYHIHANWNSKLEGIGLPLADFDGAAEVWVKDVETLLAVFDDPEYLKTVAPDEENFVDRASVKFVLGYDELKFDHS